MEPSELAVADPSEIVRKPFDQLGIQDAAGVQDLFTRLKALLLENIRIVRLEGVSTEKVEALRVRWLGRKSGIVRSITDNWLRLGPPDLKPTLGACSNELRRDAETLIEDLSQQAAPSAAIVPEAVTTTVQPGIAAVAPAQLDITLPGTRRAVGARHILRRVMDEITEIFLSLGYSVEEGPDIETTYYNFEALNIPEDHPSRDDQDTFYIDPHTVLRTHTSPVQIRTMEKMQPPVRIIVPGRAFRHDAPDATHSPFFHQVEGLAVDTHITFADLKGTIDYWMKAYFGTEVRTRLRPSFFPFTEPSAEVDISCIFCGGRPEGCRICKHTGWIELGGCGMVDPAVFSFVNYDPARYSGFAFGMGIERLAMLKYGVQDIQLFFQSDVRFLHQFR